MGPFITKVLMETGQLIPEFLEQYKPDGDLNFDEDDPDIDDDAAVADGDGGDAWAGGGGNNAAAVSEPAWGTENTAEPAWDATPNPSAAAW
jgi:ATP-dependent RNA helicase DDX3X